MNGIFIFDTTESELDKVPVHSRAVLDVPDLTNQLLLYGYF